jgi:hypothetical protein
MQTRINKMTKGSRAGPTKARPIPLHLIEQKLPDGVLLSAARIWFWGGFRISSMLALAKESFPAPVDHTKMFTRTTSLFDKVDSGEVFIKWLPTGDVLAILPHLPLPAAKLEEIVCRLGTQSFKRTPSTAHMASVGVSPFQSVKVLQKGEPPPRPRLRKQASCLVSISL